MRPFSRCRTDGDLLSKSDLSSQSTLRSERFFPSRRGFVEKFLPESGRAQLTEHHQKPPKRRRRKRLIDLALAATLIGVSLPVMALIALAVKLEGGPILYAHRRVGPDGRSFRCWKFRSMVSNADKVLHELLAHDNKTRQEWERDFKLRSDPRVTPVGRFLRSYSLDELPQLFNVVTGTMSLVGPRPIVEAEIERYGASFAAYCSCRPGITGLWQVHGRSDVDYVRRVELDRHYAYRWSLRLDLTILLKTVVVITRRHGAY
jgi:Undecaprenyl-phosphate galactose phosphotransferase WbaP